MKIYGIQLDSVWENKAANHAKVRSLLAKASPDRGSLVVLPEMFSTGFSMNVPGIAEGEKRESEIFLSRTAQELGVVMLGGVVTTSPGGRGLNQSVIFSPDGKELARYTKMQPFNLGGEGKQYEPGREIVTFPWQGFVTAPFVCYDLRFPELFRAAARRGAQLVVVIASWPVKRIHHWVTLLQARAIENLAYVVGVNRCGDDPKYSHNGHSIIVDPHGAILVDAGEKEGVMSAEVSVEEVVSWRNEFPALKDMRP
ncbi:MAG TPA: carbon-nitrogen family hydrolase [Verrucomicrobiae bacterium]